MAQLVYQVVERTLSQQPGYTITSVEGDVNSNRVHFIMNRMEDGVDLSTKDIFVVYRNKNQEGSEDACVNIETDANGETFSFDWYLSAESTSVSGDLIFQVVCRSIDENNKISYQWSTLPETLKTQSGVTYTQTIAAVNLSEQIALVGTHTTHDTLVDEGDPIPIVGRTIQMPTLTNVIVAKDANSQVLTFTIDRYQDGIDISDKTFYFKFKNSKGQGNRRKAVNVVSDSTKVTFCWLVGALESQVPGELSFEVEILGSIFTDEFYCFQTLPAYFTVERSIDYSEIINYGEDSDYILQDHESRIQDLESGTSGGGSGTGADGKSAYEIAVENGYEGTEVEWLESLKGANGDGATITIGTVTTGEPGTQASVSNSGTATKVVLDITIPRGTDGLSIPQETVADVVSSYLDDHPEMITSVQDGSITESKLEPSLVAKILEQTITDKSGVEYTVSVDSGIPIVKPKYSMVTDGLTEHVVIQRNSMGELQKYSPSTNEWLDGGFNQGSSKTVVAVIKSHVRDGISGFMFGYRMFGDIQYHDAIQSYMGLSLDQKPFFNTIYPAGINLKEAIVVTKLVDSQVMYLGTQKCPGFYTVTSGSGISEDMENAEVLFYDRELTEEEIKDNYLYFNGDVPLEDSFSTQNTCGITGLFSGTDYLVNNRDVRTVDNAENVLAGIYKDDSTNSFSINYDKLLICGNCDIVYVGYEYPLSVYPMNYRLGDSLHFTYTSSNPEICSVYAGVLFPKQEGEFTLTVEYNGTDLVATKTILVQKHPSELSPVNTFTYLPPQGSFVESLNTFINSLDYSGGIIQINIPKGEYVADIPDASIRTHAIEVPSKCHINFNGSTIHVNPSIRSLVNQNAFAFFYINGSNAKVSGFHLVGEKLTSGSGEKNHFTGMISFEHSARFSGVENFIIEHTTGMGITVSAHTYNWWTNGGTPGKVDHTVWELGDLDDNGVQVSSTTNYVTNQFIHIGYTEEYLNQYDRTFTIGRMGHGGYPNMARTYRICFYSESQEFISYVDSVLYEAILIPEGAKYFKIALYLSSAPTTSSLSGEDGAMLRLYDYSGGLYCYCKNFYYYDSSYSVCSASPNNFYLKNGVGGPSGLWQWSVDFEDGFYNMTHNVISGCVFTSKTCFVGGRSNAIINHRGGVNLASDTENSYFIGGITTSSQGFVCQSKDKLTLTDYSGVNASVTNSTYLNTIINLKRS